MEKNTGPVILIGLLAVLTILGAIQTLMLVQKTREARAAQMQLTQFENRRTQVQQFLGEVGQYAASHPAILPTLQQAGLVPPAAQNHSAKPAQPAK